MSSDYVNDDQDDNTGPGYSEDGCGYCTTARDVGIGGADGVSPSAIVHLNPHCPEHGSVEAVAQPHSSGTPGCGCVGGGQ